MEEGKGIVCVTGATGYVASWLIMSLLHRGYSVHATIRPDPEKKRDMSFLTSLPRASTNLKIFHSDLNNPSTFEAPIQGCIGVFLVASPVPTHFQNQDDQVVIKRTIDGTLEILKLCLNSSTVKRVVYTSSTSAIDFNEKSEDVEMMDESFWSDVEYIEKLKSFASAYWVSKTLTEKKVLEFSEESGLDVVTVIPSYVVGPFVCPNLPASVEVVLSMILGKPEYYYLLLKVNIVHVDDLVRAHIFLLENHDSKGRFICSSDIISIQDLAVFLSSKYPEFTVPTIESLQGIKGRISPVLSSKKLKDSGFQYKHGIDETFDEAIQCCKEKGYL
ncbi:NAD(P)-binding Rossmann-fold superfamily protein [Euphorbia peplus]|nr:NAD(P)-binding Rossmann-fold superfamily protein [Euphorbia peplus]